MRPSHGLRSEHHDDSDAFHRRRCPRHRPGAFCESFETWPERGRSNGPTRPRLRYALALRQKAAIGAIATEASSLVAAGLFDAATALLLQRQSAFEAARHAMHEVPFHVPTPRQLAGGTGGDWIAEGGAKIVIAEMFDNVRLAPHAIGNLVVLTDELLRHPHAEVVIRDMILGTAGRTETQKFLDPEVAATADHPASITNTGTAITATGDIAADLSSMLAAITAPSASGLTWIVSPLDLAMIAAAVSAPDVPRTLLGLPIVLAPNAPAHLVTLAALGDIAYATRPLEIDLSSQASVEMDGEPVMSAGATGSPAGATGTVVISLFQVNAVAYRVVRWADWAVRDGAVELYGAADGVANMIDKTLWTNADFARRCMEADEKLKSAPATLDRCGHCHDG